MKNFRHPLALTLLLLTVTFITSSCGKNNGWGSNNEDVSNLNNTKWVIKRYDNTLTNISEYPLDTIHFTSANKYNINNGNERNYYLRTSKGDADQSYILSLNDCITFGGDYWAWIDIAHLEDGEINNKIFTTVGSNDIIVWLEKLN